MSQPKEKERWQHKVALGTNAAGAIAGPAAVWMAIRQAKAKEGGMPRQAAQAVAEARPKSKLAARVLRTLKNPKAVAIGGVTGVGLQAANWAGDATAVTELQRAKRLEREAREGKMAKSFEQIVEKSDEAVRGTGHGQSLLSKRYFNSEADRQRRLGTYAGVGLGAGAVMGAEAARRLEVSDATADGVRPTKGKMVRSRLKANGQPYKKGGIAGLAVGSLVATAAGAAAYKRGISERNQPWS